MGPRVLALALAVLLTPAAAEILTPPYFNLALGKPITATATCGDEGSELYCKLAGANADQDEHVIQGQVCDICDANKEPKAHPPDYAVDGLETWWQSPPLSRGMKYNEVNLTIELGQEFHVAYVFVRMGNSPRPGVWALEKSTDYGKTYKPWQYFADSPQDCQRYFGKKSLQPITEDDSVICSTEYSKIVPLEGGEIPISLLNYRPSANKYFNSSVLQEWTRATNVRLRFIRTKNLLGHLMSVARQDPTVTRRYFYSIKDISIGGRCMCNGHADTCEPSDPESPTDMLVCRCQHNTCGPQCAECCPGFEQKKWRISQNWDRFECEPCNCHNHTTECVYEPDVDQKQLSLDIHDRYEGGGVCKNCQHNTEGINCNKCQAKYYRPSGKRWDEIGVCQPCDCDDHFSTGNCAEESGQCECRPEFQPPLCLSCAYGYFDYPNCKACTCNLNGTDGEQCTPIGGQCPCKYNYNGTKCEICADGFYSPECKNCECNSRASVSPVCDKESGNCTCLSKFAGRTCNRCDAGHYNYPNCNKCNCDTSGTESKICDDVSGECICRIGFGGARCDQCIPGYYMEVRGRERICVPCNCSAKGSTSTSCSSSGKCNCLSSFGGKQCDQCSPGYYKYPECFSCSCDEAGSVGSSCDDAGQCNCRKNFDGLQCERCKERFYNYPACEECNCDPRGVVASFAGCGSVPAGELCQCKNRVQGRICNDCMPLYWNLQEYNPLGCEECNCNLAGTLGGLGACDTRTGQCTCKLRVGEQKCDQCRDGFYNLNATNMFGCRDCGCDVGGAVDNSCDKMTGQCRCHSRVQGRRCDRPLQAHYFPTLHQFQYEVEEGLTPSGPVRFRSSEETFPEYSWKGYVIFNSLQNEVINIVHISKSSLYRMVLRYVSRLQDPVVATIIITPESVIDTQQKFMVLLKPSEKPTFVTVAGEKAAAPAPLVMDPGNWTVTIKINKEVFIDYFVLLPAAYYEATVLTKLVDKPCVVGENSLCRHFAYPNLSGFPTAKINSTMNFYLDDPEQLRELNALHGDIPLLSNMQKELNYSIKFDEPGPYVLLIEYVTLIDRTDPTRNSDNEQLLSGTDYTLDLSSKGTVIVKMESEGGAAIYGLVYLNDCPYTSACRVVLVDDQAKLQIGYSQGTKELITLSGERDTLAAVKSVVAIPESEWHLDYLTPRPYCLRREGRCAPAVFSAAVDSKKIELESSSGGDRVTRLPPILDNSTAVVYLDSHSGVLFFNSKTPAEGDYIFVIHYYQPDHPESYIDVMVTEAEKRFPSKLIVEHCPSNSGCRALLRQLDHTYRYPLRDNFTMAFETASKGVWLDYILVIKAGDYVSTVLKEANLLDYTREFISKCGANNYYINTTETGFCRDAVFSITADYNSGTLPCHCAYEGSTDLECDKFGGQCKCKPNVIGRTCSACRAGYYGYPDCKPCHCPSTAICDEYGICICPNNVEGDKCDRCKPFTFNFDMQRGCDDCNCSPLGVVDGQLQCDLDDGSCPCKHNVIGRTCDHCVPGHYGFPYCSPCHCHLAGTTNDVCDQNSAQCYCKKHVRGQACDTCKEEYYNLQADNPDGCTKCYCFGRTTRCTKSDYVWTSIVGMENWYLVSIEVNRTLNVFPLPELPSSLNASAIGVQLNTPAAHDKVVYFGAPVHYLGKRLTSYGGYLRYSILYTINEIEYGNAIAASDVVLGGANGFIIHTSVEQPPAVDPWYHAVRLVEEEFTNADGSAVTREQFMNTLVNLTAIYIRATYWNTAVTTRLLNVNLDFAVEPSEWIAAPERASSVEQCLCPAAYRGLSCEQCAEGHYRLSSGIYAGFCVPCQCNGHSNTCDVNTGVCLECGDNTMGDHCEMCIPGYHGNATGGSPYDCLICACPLPITSNNFAAGCEVSDSGSLISCRCSAGYAGARCHFCAAGYYGRPEAPGEYCRPCNCSGNIDVHDSDSCDSITGDCLKCVNNTAGAACNLCAPGFYGDAVLFKNCTACSCDSHGMERCDPTTGKCQCRPGVLGGRCDHCAPNHWGLLSGEGCTPCDCQLASEAAQCDPDNGQCKCAKGVTGKHCDVCAAGYWNYTKNGCDHCNCNIGYSVGFMCNTTTGQCECLPGVVGEKCDRCPDRSVLIPNEGCLECDSCTDALLSTVQDLYYWLTNETQDFKDKAASFFTTQRLHYVMSQTQELRPRVAALRVVDLHNVTRAITTLENRAKSAFRSAEFASTDSEIQTERATALAANAEGVLAKVQESSARAAATVKHVTELAAGLELSQQPKADSALAEANKIKTEIANTNLGAKYKKALFLFNNVSNQIDRMNNFVSPVTDQNKRFEVLRNNTKELKNKLDDLLEFKASAQRAADDADVRNANNRASKFSDKILLVNRQNTEALEDLIDTAYMMANATALLLKSQEVTNKTRKGYEDMIITNQEIEFKKQQFAKELPDFNKLLQNAMQHATILNNRAAVLKRLAEHSSHDSRTQDAYSAASAYSSIVQEIKEANLKSSDTEQRLLNATALNATLAQRVGPAYERARTLRDRAAQALRTADGELQPRLSLAEAALAAAQDARRTADDALSAIQMAIPTVFPLSLDEQLKQAQRVKSSVKDTNEIMTGLGKDVASSRDAAQTLPKTADDAEKMSLNVYNLVSNIKDTLPVLHKTFGSIQAMQSDIEASTLSPDDKLQKLRNLIEQARTVANRIGVGVTFDKSSTLQPRLPDTIDEMSTSTHISAYFKTKEKNGLLLYLGNPKGSNLRRTKSDDFMILEINQGYPNLLIDIGDGHDSSRGPVRIGHHKYVADDRWYQVIVDRVERNVKFTIRESTDDGTEVSIPKDVTIPGQHTIFNLDKKKSKLYVGGIPSGTGVQDISYPAFEGQIEELMIGDTPVGLWNFVNAENLKGARQRDKLITSQAGPAEYRFNGRGYVSVPARKHLQPDKNHIQLFFRTYASDGLIYLVGDKNYFFSIQMQKGRVYLQFCLGDLQDLVIIGTTKTYNDGKWHRLEAARRSNAGSLRLDNEPLLKREANRPQVNMPVVETMNFGGNNLGIRQITSAGFDGCIRQVNIDSSNIDLDQNTESLGVTNTCQFASLVALSGNDSFLRYENITSENFQMTLKFKTSAPDGLLFVFFNRVQDMKADSISLALVKGKLVLMSQREKLDTGLSTYNDSQWHVVTATHSNALKLVVDDFDKFSTDTAPPALHILDGVLFVGGVQPNYVLSMKVGTRVALAGCLADAGLGGRPLSLLAPHSHGDVTFGRCGDTTSGGREPPEDIWPHTESTNVLPVPAHTTTSQEITTRAAHPTNVFVPVQTTAPSTTFWTPVTAPPERTSPPTTTAPPVTTVATTMRPAPLPKEGCALGFNPSYMIGDPKLGYRFGLRLDSRIEYEQLPGRQLDGYDLSVDFRTSDADGGLIFYASEDRGHSQFLALYMQAGVLHAAFNCGGKTARLRSRGTYADGQWHALMFARTGGYGKLAADNEKVDESTTQCLTPAALAPPFFYGGLGNATKDILVNLQDFYQPFKGCLRRLALNGQPVTEERRRAFAPLCGADDEQGVYFSPNGGYLRLNENYRVGQEILVSMEIKPRNTTGLLLSVYGRRDFLVLELIEDEVLVNVENGKGPFHTSFKLNYKYALCDGQWHKIYVVKSRYAVSVGVDGHFSKAGLGNSSSTDTRSAIYVGGHERPISKLRGVKSKRGYCGCMRNLVIRQASVPIPLSAAHGDVHVGYCPKD